MKENIEKITKLIPVIYPIIIFLGYYNYFIYYRYFDIEIFHYLNISELLFSFISLVIPLLITLFLVFCYLVFISILPQTSNEIKVSSEKYFDDSFLTPSEKRFRKIQSKKPTTISLIFNKSHKQSSRSWILFRHKLKRKEYSRGASHFAEFISSVISLSIKIILWFFFINFTFASFILLSSPFKNELKYFNPFFTSTIATVGGLIIWSAIIYAIIFRFRMKSNKSAIGSIHLIPIIYIILFSITLFQKMRIEKTINRETIDIKFKYEGERIESNSNTIFLGKTSDFIFLRDLDKQTNFIYPIKDVSNIEIKKIQEKTIL